MLKTNPTGFSEENNYNFRKSSAELLFLLVYSLEMIFYLNLHTVLY
jgi:hypothetical protein